MLYRAKLAFGYFGQPLKAVIKWLYVSRETTNFTYDLTPQNMLYLGCFLAGVARKTYKEMSVYMNELKDDSNLREHIRKMTQANDRTVSADFDARYGRRIGWYALTRALKPRVIVETGVDKGLGACVLTAALMRNSAEGYPGRYYGTDINPDAGYLLAGTYGAHGRLLIGDSIASLGAFDERIDLFINDSDHSADYEAREYVAVAGKMTGTGMILGDNAHATTKLAEFALATGRQFAFFGEKPEGHWYPGGGIGVAYRG